MHMRTRIWTNLYQLEALTFQAGKVRWGAKHSPAAWMPELVECDAQICSIIMHAGAPQSMMEMNNDLLA